MISLNGIIDVKALGAKGDGATDDTLAIQKAFDAAFGPATAPNGRNYAANSAIYFPPGNYILSAPILMTSVMGGKIYGAGRFTSSVVNAKGTVFQTNGCSFTSFDDMTLIGGAASPIVALDMQSGNTGGDNLQGNEFRRIFFDGTQGASIGVEIAKTGGMGSENKFDHCHFQGLAVAGAAARGQNAVQNTIIGGNVQGCGVGFWSDGGLFSLIANVSFQQQATWDVLVDTAGNPFVITGGRSESPNFLSSASDVCIDGFNHTSGSSGTFADLTSRFSIRCCEVNLGQLNVYYAARGTVAHCLFIRPDWIAFAPPGNPNGPGYLWSIAAGNRQNAIIDIRDVQYGTPPGADEVAWRRITGDAKGNAFTRNYDV